MRANPPTIATAAVPAPTTIQLVLLSPSSTVIVCRSSSQLVACPAVSFHAFVALTTSSYTPGFAVSSVGTSAVYSFEPRLHCKGIGLSLSTRWISALVKATGRLSTSFATTRTRI
jgi:hypothetical protein